MRLWLAVFAVALLACESSEQRAEREAAARFSESDAGLRARDRARYVDDSARAERVRVANAAAVRSCEHIKHLELYEVAMAEGELVSRLRSEAAKLRADAIVFTTPAGQNERIAGEAYRCAPR